MSFKLIWPFPSRPKSTAKPEPVIPYYGADWELVIAQFPVGRKFKYLGRTLMVTRYGNNDYEQPYMATEYADKNGKLREWYFFPAMANAILRPSP